MGMPRASGGLLVPVVGLVLVAWIIELVGLYFLYRSCENREHLSPWWVAASGAQLPATDSCKKVFRYNVWTIWFEFPLVIAIVGSLASWFGADNNLLQRYRLPLIGLLATCTALQMWSANNMLNLTDTFIRKQETSQEALRAKVAFFGFAALSALNAVLMFLIGDDGPSAGRNVDESLLGDA